MQKKEKEEQAKLTKQIQEIEAKIQFEEREKQTLLGQKQEELNIKKKSIEQLTQTNQRLQTELENLRLQIGTDDKMNVTDKNEIQERNARFENEKRKRQDPLEQRLKVKQKELQNSLAILDKYKKEKDQLQKELDGKVDLIQINSLHDEIKSYNIQIETLSKEMKYFKQIEKEHSQCLIKDQAIQNEIESMKAKIKELNLENKLQLKSKRDSKSIISIFHSYKEDEMKKQEEQEQEREQNLKEFWNENQDKLYEHTYEDSVNKSTKVTKKKKVYSFNVNTKQAEINKRMKSKYEIAKQINNKNIMLNSKVGSKDNQLILPPIQTKSLFSKNEKDVLLNVLPEKEIKKYEKRFESLDNATNNLVRKFHFEEKKLIKENQDLESRVELTEMQLKENEQKNKLLKNQIEEYKKEMELLDEKLKELNDMLTLQKEKIKEKDNENKTLVIKLQELQFQYEPKKVEEEEEEGGAEEEGEEEEDGEEGENEDEEGVAGGANNIEVLPE
jgi:hypothetical protein